MKFINVPTFDTIEKLMSINETGEIELNDITYLDSQKSVSQILTSAFDMLYKTKHLLRLLYKPCSIHLGICPTFPKRWNSI